jgi:hypothetical protein
MQHRKSVLLFNVQLSEDRGFLASIASNPDEGVKAELLTQLRQPREGFAFHGNPFVTEGRGEISSSSGGFDNPWSAGGECVIFD